MGHRERAIFLVCTASAFVAVRALDAVASDCHRTYSPDPPYPLEADYPQVEPEEATTGDGEAVEDVVPYELDAWLPPLVDDSASWRLEGVDGDGAPFVLTLRAVP